MSEVTVEKELSLSSHQSESSASALVELTDSRFDSR